ncbi:hypothetical protein ASE98_24590 [Pseudomonas sp. Leaf48]|uniref:hypothetical protein n=1 Tax=Pseudomonas sp. Leaf48 TaxID=1736221 RepID=UPI000723AF02|nr:hypothetical protein [Pseudomonas sp. Leaf48]KQN49793.1 hypothetical protein ASE98_24590 [Pseudomonas sp. Leaf48]
MNTKRVVSWLAFFGVAAALAWIPELLKRDDDSDLAVASVTTPAKGTKTAPQTAAPAGALPVAIKDLSPAGDLFVTRSWKAAPALATVIEQPVDVTPEVQVPTAPPVPFEFVGRLADRSDLQVFLQSGEKIYVVRKGDVIDETWRIERISDAELSLVYLPLRLSQTLSVGSTQ